MGYLLFVDGSCDPHSKIGYGAMLCIDDADERDVDSLKREVRQRRFENCTSSSLELVCLLWALSELGSKAEEVAVYTDSQTIVGLPERRASLVETDFCSRAGKRLSQAALYREFYDAMDRVGPRIVKLKGHSPGAGKSREERLFQLVDKASRCALRGTPD